MGLQNKKQKTEGSINSATGAANRKRNPMKLDKNQKMGPQPIPPHRARISMHTHTTFNALYPHVIPHEHSSSSYLYVLNTRLNFVRHIASLQNHVSWVFFPPSIFPHKPTSKPAPPSKTQFFS